MSSSAVDLTAGRIFRFHQTTIGKKAIMAVTGFMLFGFLVGHLIGNLQIFLPPEKINHYAALLKSAPALLWGVRLTLLTAVVLHVTASVQLWMLQNEARPVKYVKKENLNSSYASRTMLWSGPIIGAFIIFHLLHFTLGCVHPNFDEHNVYNNVIIGFQQVPVSIFYIIAMSMLCFHLYHGLWSMFQSLGVNHPRYTPLLKRFSAVFAFLIAVGNISIPVAVLAGILTPVAGA
jgi:succinate dehydrogenase / fumarate reductase, cytochrome b subunit